MTDVKVLSHRNAGNPKAPQTTEGMTERLLLKTVHSRQQVQVHAALQ